MELSKKVIIIGLVVVALSSMITGCDIGKSSEQQLSLQSEYKTKVHNLIDDLESLDARFEEFLTYKDEFITMSMMSKAEQLGEDIEEIVFSSYMSEPPKAFKKSDEIFKQGTGNLLMLSDQLKGIEQRIKSEDYFDKSEEYLTTGIKKITEAMEYRMENESK